MFNPGRIRRMIEANASDREWPADFKDRLTSPIPGFREVFRAMRSGDMRPDLSDADQIPVQHDGLPAVAADQLGLTWIGHATFVVQLGGLTVLTDPVWAAKIPGVRRRLTAPGVAWSDLPPIDAVVISHNHYDHLDAPTIRRLPKTTPILVPAKLGVWFRRRGFTDVRELDWWESTTIGGVTFDFTPAHHWSRRSLTDFCKSLWGGWVLTGPGGTRMFFGGDSGYGPFFAEIGERYPGIDVAALGIGAYHPHWFMHPVHTDPAEAVQAAVDLGAARLATMHWGTFVLSGEPVTEPLRLVRDAWTGTGAPRENLWDLAVGESRVC